MSFSLKTLKGEIAVVEKCFGWFFIIIFHIYLFNVGTIVKNCNTNQQKIIKNKKKTLKIVKILPNLLAPLTTTIIELTALISTLNLESVSALFICCGKLV